MKEANYLREMGRYAEAIERYKELEQHNSNPTIKSEFAYTLLLINEINRAKELMAEAKRDAPELAIVLRTNARVLLKEKRYKEALNFALSAYKIDSKDAQNLLVLAITLNHIGELDKALQFVQTAIDISPRYAEAYANRALIFFKQKRFNEAIESAKMGLTIKPHLYDLYKLIAHLSYQGKNYQEAVSASRNFLHYRPDDQAERMRLGEYLWLIECYDESHNLFIEYLNRYPKDAVGWVNLAIVHYLQGSLNLAKEALVKAKSINGDIDQQAINAVPIALREGHYKKGVAYGYISTMLSENESEAHYNLAVALEHTEQKELALTAYKKAIQLNPKHYGAGFNLSLELIALNQRAKAIEVLEGLLSNTDINRSMVINLIIFLKLKINDWDSLEQYIEQLKQLFVEEPNANQNPFNLLSIPTISEAMQKTVAEISSHNKNKITPFPLPPYSPLGTKKLRIGFVSSDILANHPVHHVIYPLLQELYQTDLSLFIYSLGDSSTHQQKLIEITDKVTCFESDKAVLIAQEIYKDKIDVLIDLNGHTKGANLDIYHYRPAPVIVNWLGYPSTIGDAHDWILADKFAIPQSSKRHYHEKVWYLPHSFFPANSNCLSTNSNTTKEEQGIPNDVFIFSSFANSNKLNPELFDIWCTILKACNGSILWLKDHPHGEKERLKEEVKKRGVSPDRLHFSKFSETLSQYHSKLMLCDLALDTAPYGLHSTAVDYLMVGVPFLTQKGDSFASRVGESLLHASDMPEMIAKTKEEYIQKAIFLAHNPKELQSIKIQTQKLRENSNLFNLKQMAKDLEGAFISMYTLWGEEK